MENSDSKDLEQTAQTEEAVVEESADAQVVEEQPDADEKLAKELAQVRISFSGRWLNTTTTESAPQRKRWSFVRISFPT